MRKKLFQEMRGARLIAATFVAAALASSMVSVPQAGAQQDAAPGELPPAEPLVDSLPDVVARIGGHPITKLQLLRQADSMRVQALQAGATDPAHQGKQFLDLVLDALVGEYLVYLDCQSRGISASAAEVEEQVEQAAASYADEETFTMALKARGLDQAGLREEIRQQLTIDKLFSQELEAGAQPSEEALRAYYDENSHRMQHPPQLRARHILKQIPEGGDAEASRGELEALRRKIAEEGVEFGELAVTHSQDPNTRDLGGDMGWIPVTGREGSIGQLLQGLEVGAVSDVVQTQMGLHVFQVMERQPARQVAFEEAREQIARSLAAVKVREEVQRRVAELKAKTEIEILM